MLLGGYKYNLVYYMQGGQSYYLFPLHINAECMDENQELTEVILGLVGGGGGGIFVDFR